MTDYNFSKLTGNMLAGVGAFLAVFWTVSTWKGVVLGVLILLANFCGYSEGLRRSR